MSTTNTTQKPALDIDAIVSNKEVLAAIMAMAVEKGLIAKPTAAFKPGWHVDDKGMVILEFSGNPFSKANPYMAGSTALRFLGEQHPIGKEIKESAGKTVATSYRKQGADGKWKSMTGTVVFQLDPPAAPKEDKTTTVNAVGAVVSDADKVALAALLAKLGQ